MSADLDSRLTSRMVLDARYDVYCGVHFDVERAAVEAVAAAYLRRVFAIRPEEATPVQRAAAEEWTLDERHWSESMDGVIPLHRCGDHG
ncbi:MAG TPA: hypothetical protein VHL09_07455 [Dehalococcoidia bacterium]|nr:hypothetical protein [Dehalococcoidia bacterium]